MWVIFRSLFLRFKFARLSTMQETTVQVELSHLWEWHTAGDSSIVYTGFTKHTRFRRYSATWHNTGPIESMMILFVYFLYQHIDTLKKVPTVIAWHFCYEVGLLLILSYSIMSWKILFLSFMLLIWLVIQINRTLSVEK